jgi:hypothetical protein
MELLGKMFCCTAIPCRKPSEGGSASDRRHQEWLFDKDWEVFVIRRDPESGKFDWFTLCCEK